MPGVGEEPPAFLKLILEGKAKTGVDEAAAPRIANPFAQPPKNPFIGNFNVVHGRATADNGRELPVMADARIGEGPTQALEHWQKFREAAEGENYAAVKAILQQELHCQSALDLLPLLRGVLAEVIMEDDMAQEQALLRRDQRVSAFDKFRGGDPLEVAPRPGALAAWRAQDPGQRRWRRSMRALLTADAAAAMMREFIGQYRSPAFSERCKAVASEYKVRKGIGPGSGLQERKAVIDKLCVPVQITVIERYGFSPDEAGIKDMEALLSTLEIERPEIKALKVEVDRVLFVNLGDMFYEN
eukprot:gnl/TRDRNA2_/TRDRNA2_128803_c0_seq2.p1 gnl/TRDRNA2_/TRDRNA2_128803_c0~~gnl/TRDRNA2_/TRDRNA2_128803_c0_seq2.p1  ORF type:complete len:300 (-),score=68.92 gnl/TRDRNA2_/TRDRNA2_128803_c0_seq2:77-976(-)